MSDLSYPIGKFKWEGPITEEKRQQLIDEIAGTPARMRAAVAGLSDSQLDTPYRPGGWTVRQVVHHVPDSHLNGYIRFKFALTEDRPTIKAYNENSWAQLPDSSAPIDMSLSLLESLHERWVVLLRSLTSGQCARSFIHPEIGEVSLDEYIGLDAWHGAHHIAHITSLRDREGWGRV